MVKIFLKHETQLIYQLIVTNGLIQFWNKFGLQFVLNKFGYNVQIIVHINKIYISNLWN